jgi:RES domain-containing protein
VYVALDRRTATAELKRLATRAALPLEAFLPRVLLSVQVQLHKVLDLTDAQARQAWGITPDELTSSDWIRCQSLARRARELGFEAIRFPSAAGTGHNLAIFLDRLEAGSRVEVIGSEELVLDRR